MDRDGRGETGALKLESYYSISAERLWPRRRRNVVERPKMPVKVKPRPMNSLRADQTANIPTTIKNPVRVAHRRTELIEVATKLFLERGFHNTSIRDIVRACSFNIASLYMYVSSKEDILYLVALD